MKWVFGFVSIISAILLNGIEAEIASPARSGLVKGQLLLETHFEQEPAKFEARTAAKNLAGFSDAHAELVQSLVGIKRIQGFQGTQSSLDDDEKFLLFLAQAVGLVKEPEGKGAFSSLLQLARSGHLPSMHTLGMASMLGKSTGLNPEEGFLWVREAAYGGLAGAQFVMGKMRLAGVQGILTMDEEEGESWLVSAAIGDHPEAKLLCVERFGVGPATENLLAIGPVWAKELADEDHPVGLHAFGLVLAELADPGLGEEGLLPCIAPLSAAAQAGYAPALHDLALVLLAAPGLSTKDMDPNVLLRQAVAADYAPAFHDLADLLVAKPELADVVFSIGTVLQRGIELGDLRCQSSVGLLALQGLWQGIEAELCLEWVEDGAIAGILDPGVFLAERAAIQFHPEDVENTIDYLYEAEAWLESLAELGDPDALWELVKFHDQYAQYLELEIDFRFNEYLAAASAGSVEAQMQVGNIYLSGYESIPKDSIEATRWIKSAIAAGGEAAVESLAQCYESGNGVPFWPEQAIRLRNLFGLTNEISGEK